MEYGTGSDLNGVKRSKRRECWSWWLRRIQLERPVEYGTGSDLNGVSGVSGVIVGHGGLEEYSVRGLWSMGQARISTE